MFCLNQCMCTTCIPGTYEGHKGSSDPLGLVLQTVASCRVGAGNLTGSLQEQQGLSMALLSLLPQFSFHNILLSIRYFAIATTTTTKTMLRHVERDETFQSQSKRRLVFK